MGDLMKEIEKFWYKNNFKERRLSKGITLEAMAKRLQLQKKVLKEIEDERFCPHNPRSYAWKKAAKRIAKFFHTKPEYIWGLSTMTEVKSRQKHCRVLYKGLNALIKGKIKGVLDTLTPHEEKVLKMRFRIGERADRKGMSGDFAKAFAKTREMIRHQLETKALRKLRDPSKRPKSS